MAAVKRLILENKMGQKIRSVRIPSEQAHVIYRRDTRRVELVSDLDMLADQEIEFDLIKSIQISQLAKGPMPLPQIGYLHIATENESIADNNVALPTENDEEKMMASLKKSGIGHLIAVGLLIILSVVVNYFNKKDIQEPQLVTIVVPEEKQLPTPKVQVSEAPVKKQIVQKHAKVTNRTKIRPPTVKAVARKTIPVRKTAAPVVRERSDSSLQRVGALAALGGIKSGARDAEGLDANSLKNIRSAGRGFGGGGVGDAGRGGIKGMMNGSGLIAGSAGNGGRAQSAGGYGTRGVGGGRAGYGKITMVGGNAGLGLPTDEAEVQGGLDMNQIAAVINKNKGQIIYCYEKGLQQNPNLSGRVGMQFVIGGAGRITTLKVAQSSLRSRSVETCMAAKMRSWKFPQPVGKVNVDVFYPFDLVRQVSAI